MKTQTGTSLSNAIQKIIDESVKSKLYHNAAVEKEKQSQFLGEEDDDLFGSDEDKKSAEQQASKSVDAEKDKLKKGDISSDDIVEKLNTIRSGKSFKDDAIANKLDEYVSSLTKAEKTALLAFLKGLSQIVTGEISAQQAIDPASKPADVKMQKGEEKQTKTVKPNVIKTPPKEDKAKKPSKEDTSGPVPITPKKK